MNYRKLAVSGVLLIGFGFSLSDPAMAQPSSDPMLSYLSSPEVENALTAIMALTCEATADCDNKTHITCTATGTKANPPKCNAGVGEDGVRWVTCKDDEGGDVTYTCNDKPSTSSPAGIAD